MKGVKLIAFLLIAVSSFSQEDTVKRTFKDVVQLRGYIKDMQTFSFADDLNDIVNDNLIHNRLNLRVYPTKKLSIGLEMRNRIFTGESVDMNPFYASWVDVDNGLVDMSWVLVDEPSLVFLTQLDRAWIDYTSDKWEFRIGRQRINWGINTYWNSNDLFNAYSLVDFDYEERNGSDAVRIQRYFKNMSSLELAVKPGLDSSDWVGGLLYKFNKWQYDFQFLSGWYYDDIAVGMGWAGNIKYIGFKGESTFFIPTDNSSGVLSTSVSLDYIFPSTLYLMGGYLFNSQGADTVSPFAMNLYAAPISAKNLMPMKHSALMSLSYPFTEIFSASLVSIYSPGVNSAFFMPSFNLSVAQNWDVSLYGQSVWMETDVFRNLGNGVYIRLKGSF